VALEVHNRGTQGLALLHARHRIDIFAQIFDLIELFFAQFFSIRPQMQRKRGSQDDARRLPTMLSTDSVDIRRRR